MNTYTLHLMTKVALVAGAAQTHPAGAPKPRADGPASISAEQSPPARVAFLHHRGAYWSVGPTLSKVQQVCMEQGLACEMFVRYQRDPRRVSPSRLDARVGLVLGDGEPPPCGFDVEERPTELVASMAIRQPGASLARHYTTLEGWAKANGYRATGPVTELYSTGTRETTQVVEVRLVIERVDDEASRAISSARLEVPTQERPGRGTPAGVAARSNGVAALQRPSSQWPPPAIDPPATSPPPGVPALPTEIPDRREAPTDPMSDIQPSALDFSDFARRAIPPRGKWSMMQEATLGPAVMRVRAIAHLAKTRYGSDALPIGRLSAVLTDRYSDVVGSELIESVAPRAKIGRPTLPSDETLSRLDRIFAAILTEQTDAKRLVTDVVAAFAPTRRPPPLGSGMEPPPLNENP